MRQTIFISHAAPEDNDFSLWLSLQLVGLGYLVWSDCLKLKGGEDWWPLIESEIRDNSIKFLVVLSKSSNTKDGVLKELALASKVKKQLEDKDYIIPLHIDSKLSFDDYNVELIRLNSINFVSSWADGLKQLLEKFENDLVPKKSENHKEVKNLWDNIFLQNKKVVDVSEIYSSNWFEIMELPKVLRFHKFKYAIPYNFDFKSLPYPAIKYKDYLVSFAWCYDFMEQLPKTTTYDKNETIEIDVNDIINGTYSNQFIKNKEAKNFIVMLLNEGFESSIRRKPVLEYKMSNKVSFWIKKGTLEKDRVNKIQLVGKQKDKNWHFGISGNVKLFPEKCFVIYPHIWFTSDGETLIPEISKQHAARRKQGKNWWNNDWRDKILAFMFFLAEDDCFVINVGSEEIVKVSIKPIYFKSPVSYIDPNKENLTEEDFYLEEDEDISIDIVNNEIQ